MKPLPVNSTTERVRTRWLLPATMVACSLVSAAASLLGWTVSGSKVRNSYETFRSAQRLGLDELTPFRVLWFLVPVAALAVLVTVMAQMNRLAGILLILQCVIIASVGLVVIAAPLPTASGPFIAIFSGMAGIVAGFVALLKPSS